MSSNRGQKIPWPDFDDPAWNERRTLLQEDVVDAVCKLVDHMGGGVPVELAVTIKGVPYILRMDRVPMGRRNN